MGGVVVAELYTEHTWFNPPNNKRLLTPQAALHLRYEDHPMNTDLPFIDPTARRNKSKIELAPRPMDIAGKGLADPTNLVSAVLQAAAWARPAIPSAAP